MGANTICRIKPTLHDGVLDLMIEHDCLEELHERVALAVECVPDVQQLEVRLLSDPDEEGRCWVVMAALVPPHINRQTCLELQAAYIRKVVQRAFPTRLQFSFILRVEPETP